jgi:plasmid stabilization system protein ParE
VTIRYGPGTTDDLDQIERHLTDHASEKIADQLLNHVAETLERLIARNPPVGRLRPEFGPEIRSFPNYPMSSSIASRVGKSMWCESCMVIATFNRRLCRFSSHLNYPKRERGVGASVITSEVPSSGLKLSTYASARAAFGKDAKETNTFASSRTGRAG